MTATQALVVREQLKQLENHAGGRIGVHAINTGTNEVIGHREEERFAMCSTFKWALAAAILTEIDRGRCTLSQLVPFTEDDLLEYAPITRARVTEGRMPLAEVLEATVCVSDNTAANLLLSHLGGPAQFTHFMRKLGDTVTRLDRNEPLLNTNELGDPRDTTSPKAMAQLLGTVFTGNLLSRASRDFLLKLMFESRTGNNRLKKGFPPSYRIADKTGTGKNGAVNDVAIVWPPNAPPLLIAVYLSESLRPTAELESVHVDIGRIVARAWGISPRVIAG